MSEKPKFTPWPWKSYRTVYEDLSGDCYTDFGVECVETRRSICTMCGADSEEEMQANADLMAVAPEMYELLAQFRRYIAEGPLGTRGEMYKRIDALLAKARGEEK